MRRGSGIEVFLKGQDYVMHCRYVSQYNYLIVVLYTTRFSRVTYHIKALVEKYILQSRCRLSNVVHIFLEHVTTELRFRNLTVRRWNFCLKRHSLELLCAQHRLV